MNRMWGSPKKKDEVVFVENRTTGMGGMGGIARMVGAQKKKDDVVFVESRSTGMGGFSRMFNKNRFTNTITEAFSENNNLKYLTVLLIMILIGLIVYCMLNKKTL
jgi:hypothetical protein